MVKITYPHNYLRREETAAKRPWCSRCDEKIQGRHFYILNDNGVKYCAACWHEMVSKCFMCTIEEVRN